MLTTSDIAKELLVSQSAVRRWLRAGQLKAVRAGRAWRVREADLEEYLCRNARRGVSSEERPRKD